MSKASVYRRGTDPTKDIRLPTHGLGVPRVHAQTVPAQVIKYSVGRNGFQKDLVRNTVSEFSAAQDPNAPIVVISSLTRRSPNPAIADEANLGPKTLFYRDKRSWHAVGLNLI